MRVRKFLNRPGHHAGAYVLAAVEDSTKLKQDPNGLWPWVEVSLTLADCSRVVGFDFELETASERRNSLHKIDLLAETLNRFQEALHEEAALAEQRDGSARKRARKS